jgi:Flp pilus assembly protein TadD
VSRILLILQELLDALLQESSLPIAERGTGASDDSLEDAISLCQRAIAAVGSGQSGIASEHLRRLARLAVDEWSLGSGLTAKVAECAQLMDG